MTDPFRQAVLGVLIGAALSCVPVGAAVAGEMEDAVLAEINFARLHPQEYAQRLLLQPVSDWEGSLSQDNNAQDNGAYAEAIEFLLQQAPLPALESEDDLASAALEHVAAQGPSGEVGHDGPAGEPFHARLRRHGLVAQIAGENIAYGPNAAADVVRELIIDSGVADRGHRRNIFYSAFDAVGVSCGPHRDYGVMCVMDFSGAAHQRPIQLASVGSVPF